LSHSCPPPSESSPPYPISHSISREPVFSFGQDILLLKVGEASITSFLEPLNPLLKALLSVGFHPSVDNLTDGDIGIDAMEVHIFHELLVVHVIGLEKRIVTAVEFERENVMPFAEAAVKGRRGFHPFPLQIKFHKAMIDEKVGSDEINELFCGKMVADIGKSDTGGDTTGPS
jgi:hypothetical protein